MNSRSFARFFVGLAIIDCIRVTLSQHCDSANYTLIEDPRRSTLSIYNITADAPICDRGINEEEWFRFDSTAGDRIPEREIGDFVPIFRCGTKFPIYIRGLNSHPTTDDTTVNATVCANYGRNTRQWSETIHIHKCPSQGSKKSYYIYRLKSPPGCSLAYCSEEGLPASPTMTELRLKALKLQDFSTSGKEASKRTIAKSLVKRSVLKAVASIPTVRNLVIKPTTSTTTVANDKIKPMIVPKVASLEINSTTSNLTVGNFDINDTTTTTTTVKTVIDFTVRLTDTTFENPMNNSTTTTSTVASSVIKSTPSTSTVTYPTGPCSDYRPANMANGLRSSDFNSWYSTISICDAGLDPDAWYRFEHEAGNRLLEYRAEPWHCGTQAPIWLNGTHPRDLNSPEKIVPACSNFGSQKYCDWSGDVHIRLCSMYGGTYYVYKLAVPPGCPLAYCVDAFSQNIPGTTTPSATRTTPAFTTLAPIGPGWSGYGPQSECSKQCDYGLQSRRRICGQLPCDGVATLTETCNGQSCTKIPKEKNEGIILVLKAANDSENSLLTVLENEDVIYGLFRSSLNKLCSENASLCCGYNYTGNPLNNEEFVTLGDIYRANGSLSKNPDGSANIQVIAVVNDKIYSKVCQGNSNPISARRKRSIFDALIDFFTMLAAALDCKDKIKDATGLTMSDQKDPSKIQADYLGGGGGCGFVDCVLPLLIALLSFGGSVFGVFNWYNERRKGRAEITDTNGKRKKGKPQEKKEDKEKGENEDKEDTEEEENPGQLQTLCDCFESIRIFCLSLIFKRNDDEENEKEDEENSKIRRIKSRSEPLSETDIELKVQSASNEGGSNDSHNKGSEIHTNDSGFRQKSSTETIIDSTQKTSNNGHNCCASDDFCKIAHFNCPQAGRLC